MLNNFLNIKKHNPNSKEEIFENIISEKNITIERIISFGQKTEKDKWLYDKRNEWVILLRGKAKILFEDGKIYKMQKGDYILIKSKTKHKVLYTSKKPPCIWLAIYY
ncbi:MAG: cupin domain-containing protein [Ignavibacteria bacterium]|nr:cupin domain-containing protein [Ignavibacteria bacterium]